MKIYISEFCSMLYIRSKMCAIETFKSVVSILYIENGCDQLTKTKIYYGK